MPELQVPSEDDYLAQFRVGVDFVVGARDMPEARALVDRMLEARAPGGLPFVSRDYQQIDPDRGWGVSEWERVPQRPGSGALVQEKYPRPVNDLTLVENVRMLTTSRDQGGVPELSEAMRERLQELVEDTDPLLRVEDPDHRYIGRMIYEGPARDAAEYLVEGVYQAQSWDDAPHMLVVAPSELAPSGRVSAAFPQPRGDARSLDEVARLLRDYEREKPVAPMLRRVNSAVQRTGREGLPPWMVLPGEITHRRGVAADERTTPVKEVPVFIAQIEWLGDPEAETTVIAHRDASMATYEAAKLVHEILQDEHAYAGATDFLTEHRGPAEWFTYEDAALWLERLQKFTDYPSVTIRPGTLVDPERPAEPPAPGHDQEREFVNVGVIEWTNLGDQEPTVYVDSDPVALSRHIVTSIHDELVGSPDLFTGAVAFLDQHPLPIRTLEPADVDQWLDALRKATSFPAYSIQRLPIGRPASSGHPDPAAPLAAAPASEEPLFTYEVPVTFDVSAGTEDEARQLIDGALTGDAAPGTPGLVQRGQQVRSDGDVHGVLGWHHPPSANPVEQLLQERAREIDPTPPREKPEGPRAHGDRDQEQR
ncbi:hypothetical protein VVR84_14060 [Kocuria carniphila]|uniref:Uncharacterized protein n=1 Tax=Kocuria carniphila TaxID=262208 RepID=A0ABV3V7Y7_9MICC